MMIESFSLIERLDSKALYKWKLQKRGTTKVPLFCVQNRRKMQDKKVNILGEIYTIKYNIPEEEMPENSDGVMDYSIKTIKIAELVQEKDTVVDLQKYRSQVVRHEILHAFLYESGLWSNSNEIESWALNEEMVDWFAIQFPKIFNAFKEAGCL